MRDSLIILSLLVTLAFAAFNYYEINAIYQDLDVLKTLNEIRAGINEDRIEVNKVYAGILQGTEPDSVVSERSGDAGLMRSDYRQIVEQLKLSLPADQTRLLDLLDRIAQTRLQNDGLQIEQNHRERSPDQTHQWLIRLDVDYVKALRYMDLLTESLVNDTRERLAIVLPWDVLMILLIFSLWYWLGHDKQKRHLDATMALNRDLEQKKVSLLASQKVMASIYDDMRQERTTALSLASDNQQLASIVEQANDVIFRIELDGHIQSVNNAARKLFSRSSEQLRGSKFSSLFRKKDESAVTHAIEQVVKSRGSKTIHIAPYGENDSIEATTVYEAGFSCLLDREKNIISIVVMVRDISHQYQEVEQLRRIVHQAPNALIMVGEQGEIVLSNEKADQLFGYAPAELLGEEVENLVPDYYRDAHRDKRDLFLKVPRPRFMGQGKELKLRRKDGSLVPVEIGLSPIVARDKHFIIASVVDMSETVSQKRALNRSNRQLSEKNRELEQFIYTVSHDLRSPLVTIEAFSRKLARELEGQLTEKQSHRLARIHANVSHMEQLLTDLLALSRVIKRELEVSTLDTNKLVAKMLNTLEAEISGARALIEVEQPLLPIRANDSLFYQCLQNLVVNAIKYRDDSRRLQIKIGTTRRDNMTGLMIEDNGIGIDGRYHDQIFRIFERLEESSGTGVGLAIVNTIVEKHGGKIVLESEAGTGSRFILYFPDKADHTDP